MFTPGNCYGIIGANGAGKSTFLRVLSGDLDPTTGNVSIKPGVRMSVLKQDHFAYDEFTVLDTVIKGNERLYEVMKEKDAIYMKEEFTDEDGIRAAELEAEFAEMDGWEAESDVSRLIQGLGLSNDILYSQMSSLTGKEKVKVLTEAAGVTLGDIITIDYSWGEIAFLSEPMHKCMSLAEECCMSSSSYDIDIEPDDIDVTDTVTVVWKIS